MYIVHREKKKRVLEFYFPSLKNRNICKPLYWDTVICMILNLDYAR